VLPLAAPTGTKVCAEGLDSVFGVIVKMNGFPFHEGTFAFGDSYIDHIAWSDIGYKYYLAFVVP
jgi:hypothetical protein